MDHDANFVGGRLRLATFLRVVKLEMPQRPSRFQRRMQSVGHQSHVSVRLLSGDIEPPIVAASMDEEMRKPTCTAVRLSETESVKRADHYKETGSLFDNREVTPKSTVPAGSVFEVPARPRQLTHARASTTLVLYIASMNLVPRELPTSWRSGRGAHAD
jgi:hypothetical protein